MKDYHQKSMEALQLAGKSPSTQEAYTRSVRQLVDFFEKTPDKIFEDDLKEYFLHRRNKDKWSPSTMRIAHTGIKFFFSNVLKHDWHLFNYLNVQKERRLPCILSREEVYQMLDHVTTFHNYTYLSTVYACGLRLSESLALQVNDIDSKRMMIHVHRGKGAKDR
ncbi:tyrosine-type recombinase/integrase, partial [Thermodesulfobacteriota bacterium]